jgi:hypothetical protein
MTMVIQVATDNPQTLLSSPFTGIVLVEPRPRMRVLRAFGKPVYY